MALPTALKWWSVSPYFESFFVLYFNDASVIQSFVHIQGGKNDIYLLKRFWRM